MAESTSHIHAESPANEESKEQSALAHHNLEDQVSRQIKDHPNDSCQEEEDGDQNYHFYKEYCRLYYANIILTNRL